jgi:hypothetical protein
MDQKGKKMDYEKKIKINVIWIQKHDIFCSAVGRSMRHQYASRRIMASVFLGFEMGICR